MADDDEEDENEQVTIDNRATSTTVDNDIVNILSPNTTSCDSITSPRDGYEAKKQQESASHSEYDSQQQRGATIKPSQSQVKSRQQSTTQAPTSQQKSARELKTADSR